jgi:hypothetical protein
MGKRIGWHGNRGQIFLDPQASYKAALEMARNGEGIPVAEKTLHKRMNEAGMLAATDPARERLVVRRVVDGRRRSVLHIRRHLLLSEPTQ